MKTLNETYTQKTRIIDALKQKFLSLPAATDTAASLRDTYMNTEAILRALEHHEIDVNSQELYRKILMRKYPEWVRDLICPKKKLIMTMLRERILPMIENKEDAESALSNTALGPAADPLPKPETKTEVLAFASARQKG